MTTQIQRRRGTTAQHSTFTGAVGEVTVDTDKEVLVVHDGAQVGGYPQMRENGSNSALALGSAGTPSLKFAGDTNTGIYSPGADQVAISTGGTQKLAIDSSGNVSLAGPNLSIGGTAPSNAGYSNLYVNNTSGAQLFLSVNGSNSRVIYSTATDLNYYISNSSPHIWFTNAAERMRLDSSGRLGIGTSSPSSKLNVVAPPSASGVDGIALNNGTRDAIGLYVTGSSYSSGSIGSTQTWLYANEGDLNITNDATGVIKFSGDLGVERMRIDSQGRVGIGTTSASERFHVVGGNSRFDGNYVSFNNNGYIRTDATNELRLQMGSSGTVFSNSGNTEIARFDTSGRLLVGTSSASATGHKVEIDNGSSPYGLLCYTSGDSQESSFRTYRNSSGTSGLKLEFARGTKASPLVVQNGDRLGYLGYVGYDGTNYQTAASIDAYVDGTPGANDMPGRLVFSTTADGASSPTERMRITNDGYFKFTNSGSYRGATSTYNEIVQGSNVNNLFVRCSHASFTSTNLLLDTVRAANSAYFFLYAASGDSADAEFILRGDGQAYADGSWNGGGADYAEYFEWSDSNPDEEDRRGISVVLDGEKIREAVAGEDPIGVISGNPSVVGDAAWNKWSGKYMRDEFGTYIQEDYEVVNDEGETVVQQRRKLNPAYDPDQEYIPREQRPEWDCVGLMGKLRIRKGQITGSRWIKMRDISDSVEEWLVR